MKVHHILFLLWIIVFAAWMAKQFSAANKKRDEKLKALRAASK